MKAAGPRLQIGSIFAAYAISGVFWGAYVTSLPAFKEMTGLSEARFGALLILPTVGGILAMQALGRVLHMVQAYAIPATFLLLAGGMVLMGLATGAWVFGAALLLAGAASGAMDISLNMRLARIEQDFDIRLFNRVHAVFPFAMLVVAASVGSLREWGATPAQIFPAAALPLVAMAALEWVAGRHQRPGQPHPEGQARPRLTGIVLVLGALAALGAMLESGAHTWSALFVEGPLGSGPFVAGIAASAITLGLTVGRLTAHRLEHAMRDMVIIRLSTLVIIPALVILSTAQTPVQAILGFFLAGFGIGPIEPAVYRSVAKRHAEADRGRALALAAGLAYTGYLLSPPVMGFLIEARGWPVMWLALCLVALAASGLTTRVPPAAKGAAQA